jgi:2'-5' RNA ligase
MHVTLIYLGKNAPLSNIIKAFAVLASFAQKRKPFLIGCAVRTCFPENPDDGTPIIARVQSLSLAKLRSELMVEMNMAGVQYIDKYPEFKPHITLSYSDEPCEDLGFNSIVWKVNALTIWGGESMKDRVVASVELEG